MWFTKEERIGLLLIGISMLAGGLLLNKKEEGDLATLKNAALEGLTKDVSEENVKVLKRKLNLNTASFDELTRVPGIGPKTALLILERRERKKFANIDELKEIKGIGDKKLEKIKEYVEVR